MANKYYWLRLKRDFFKRHDIRIIESMPNGKDYILFYLKLLCESVDHDGNLRFSEQIPYNEEMLSTITNTNIDVVRSAIKIFTQLDMMEIMDDGTYYMSEVEKLVGSSADNDNANRQRRFREKQKLLAVTKSNASVTECVTKNNASVTECVTKNNESKSKSKSIEIEIETEIEKEKEREKEKRESTPYQLIADLYNDTCVSFPRITTLSDARKKAIKARFNTYTLDDFRKLFEKAEASNFLKGGNDRNWSANFDWLIKDSNMAKVLDGNYDNRGSGGAMTKPQNKVAQELDTFYEMAANWAEGRHSQ